MPSSLPKYSGLISEHQLSILSEFIVLHEGISKARVLGRLLEAWQDAGKPILGDRDATMQDLALQFERLDLDALVAQKVQEYLDIHLNSLVNYLVENKLRPISNIDKRAIVIDDNSVKNQLLTNHLEKDENLVQGNIADDDNDGELKVVPDKDKDKDEKEVVSLPVQREGEGEQRLGDKQKGESDPVSNKGIDQVNDLSKEDSNEGIDRVDDLNEKDDNKDTNQVEKVSEEDISPTEQGHNLVSNKVRNKVIENDEGKQDVKDSSTPTITEENPASQLVNIHDNNKINNQADVSHIPADFLALPQGKVETKILAQTLGLSSSARVSELASGKKKTLPFPEFWDYLSVKKTTKTDKNGKQVNSYEWTKIK